MRGSILVLAMLTAAFAEQYAFFDCNSDGSLVSYGEECSDDHCDDCEDTDTITCGACTAEDHDGETEYITYECSGSTITMKVYEVTGVAGCDDDSFLDSDETISYTVGECVEDEHGHDEHDEDEISGARGRERASLASLLIAVGALLTAN